MSVKWEILKDKANEEVKKKNFNVAISLYTDSIRIDPNQDSSYSNRGLCYLNMKKYNEAKSDLNKAINLNSKNVKALKRLAHVHLSLAELSEAEIYAKRCVEVDPEDKRHKDDLELIKHQKEMLAELNKAKFILDYEKSEALSEKLLETCKDTTKIKLIYLESLLQNCKAEKALDYMKKNLSDEEKRKEEFEYFLCLAYYYDGKYEKAKQILSKIIAVSKEDDKIISKYNKIWENLKKIETEKDKANDYYRRAEYDSAIEMYTKLLELDTNNKTFNSTIYANLALCYQKKSLLINALRDINKSIALNERYWKAYYRRATINFALKNIAKAKEDLNIVLSKDPNNRDAVLLLDDVIREEKKSNKRDFYKILELGKESKQEEIRKSYKKLASKWHPDKNNESDELRDFADKKFKDINEAYSILSDERKRLIYDKGEHPDNPNSSFHTDFKNQEEAYEETYQFYTNTDKTDHHAHRTSKNDYNSNSQYKSKKKQKKDFRY